MSTGWTPRAAKQRLAPCLLVGPIGNGTRVGPTAAVERAHSDRARSGSKGSARVSFHPFIVRPRRARRMVWLLPPSPLICEELETVCETRRTRASFTSKLLKQPASGVLAALRGSTYRKEYASPLRLLRPCWTAFLNSLLEALVALKMAGCSPIPLRR